MSRVVCRALVAADCLHDRPLVEMFGDPDAGMSDDGTFDGSSLVCDPCYMLLMPLTPSGKGLLAELPTAIIQARGIKTAA